MMKVEMQKMVARALAMGYLGAVRDTHDDAAGVDAWLIHDGMDINLIGADYSETAPGNSGLTVVAYPEGWVHNLPEPLFVLTVKYGESK